MTRTEEEYFLQRVSQGKALRQHVEISKTSRGWGVRTRLPEGVSWKMESDKIDIGAWEQICRALRPQEKLGLHFREAEWRRDLLWPKSCGCYGCRYTESQQGGF